MSQFAMTNRLAHCVMYFPSVIYSMYNGPGEKEEDRRDTLEMDLEEIKRLAKEATPPPTFSTDGTVIIHEEEDDYG